MDCDGGWTCGFGGGSDLELRYATIVSRGGVRLGELCEAAIHARVHSMGAGQGGRGEEIIGCAESEICVELGGEEYVSTLLVLQRRRVAAFRFENLVIRRHTPISGTEFCSAFLMPATLRTSHQSARVTAELL